MAANNSIGTSGTMNPQQHQNNPSSGHKQNDSPGENTPAEDSTRKQSCIRRFLAWDGSLAILSFAGAAVGFGIGLTLYYVQASGTAVVWVGLIGELYMRMLKGAVVPLIVCSIIPGTAGLKPKENGKVTAVAMIYVVATNVIGAILGTVLAVIIKPGSGETSLDVSTTVDRGNLATSDLFADLIRNFFPDNVVTSTFEMTQTYYREVTRNNVTSLERYLGSTGGTNILGLLIVCAAVGMAAAQSGEIAQPFLSFLQSGSEVIIRLIQWIVWLTPLGVASLIAKAVGSTHDLEETFRGLGLFVLAEVIGNFLLAFVMVPLIYLVFIRKNPFIFLARASRAIITGIATASSVVTMPEIINCVERKNHVDTRVCRFVVPLAIAFNCDGSAMFIACTSTYIAQLQGSDTVNNIILIAILASVGSLAIPGVPSASLVTILTILASLEISPANIGIIIALDWFSDRLRATPNMVSHVMCGVLTWKLCKDSLGFVRRPSILDPHQDVIPAEDKQEVDGFTKL